MSHNACHTVTNTVSHIRPDQTRPDQTFIHVSCGGGTASIDLTVGVDAPQLEAWMLEDLNLLDDGNIHCGCRTRYPTVKVLDTFVAICGRRAVARMEEDTYIPPPNACPKCLELCMSPCPVCGKN